MAARYWVGAVKARIPGAGVGSVWRYDCCVKWLLLHSQCRNLIRTLYLGVSLVVGSGASAATFHVAPDGDDAWSGTQARPNAGRTDGPKASLTGARDAIRVLKASGPLTEPVTVLVAEGQYVLNSTVEFTAVDSGTESAPITYAAAPGARPIFSGGTRITGWKRGPNGAWTTELPEMALGRSAFDQLFVNDRRATRARSPNDGYFYLLRRRTEGVDVATGKVVALGNRSFEAQPEDVASLAGVKPAVLTNAAVVVYHSWTVSWHRVASVEADAGAVTLVNEARWPFLNFGPSQRFRIENVPAALDAPGEWYLGPDGRLTYLPLAGEDLETAEVVAPRVEAFLRLNGGGQWLEWLNFRDLNFRYGQYVLPANGFVDNQAAVLIGAGIEVDASRHVKFEGGSVAHTGTFGLWFRRRCLDCQVAGMRFDDLGGGGIKIGEAFLHDEPIYETRRVTVENCQIANCGQIHAGAAGIWVGHSPANRIVRNEISNQPYSGISLGWRWDYGRSGSLSNRVEFNHVHHLGWGVLSDLAGIYTLGVSTGTAVRNNVIHDVLPYDYYGRGSYGVYLDAGSSGITVENNLVYNTKGGALHLHFGRDNVVRNNIFAFGADAQAVFSRPEDHLSLTFERNLLYWRGGPALLGPWERAKVRSDHNLFWNATREPVLLGTNTLAGWQKLGRDAASVVADPRFADPERFDFSLGAGSPANQLGFQPFDVASVRGKPATARSVGLSSSRGVVTMVPPPKPPAPPPMRVLDGFEATPLKALPLDAKCFAKLPALIAITDEQAASGSRSLKILDAGGLERSWEPFFEYLPNHQSGVSRCEFDLLLTPGAELLHEWRDNAAPYRIGPSLLIARDRLQIGGKDLMSLPVGQWIRVAVSSKLGTQADGKWSLEVTLPRKQTQRFAPFTHGRGQIRSLAWVGFVSLANTNTVVYLDNLRIENQPASGKAAPVTGAR